MAPPHATVQPLGFTRLTPSTQSDDEFSLNYVKVLTLFSIIFIHGLRGHPRRTWEEVASPSSVDSNATKTSKSLQIRSFLQRKSARSPAPETSQAQSPPSIPASSLPATVFWPEDLGGIILKDAIRRSETTQERTKLIVFLGTPHRGSKYAGWGQTASNIARVTMQDSNKKILETLEVNNEILDNIHETFMQIVFKGKFKVHSFYEARGVTGMRGLKGKVVDNFSSKLDLSREFETVESIDANHMQMARCTSRDDQVYRTISGVLKTYVKQQLKNQQTSLASGGTATGLTDAASSKALFMVPFSQDNFFIGREDVIHQIKERRKAATSHTRTALVGLGGVGKSQIAIEYAYRARKETPHMMVMWIHASSPERFQQGYKKIAKKLQLPGWDDPKTDVLQLVYEWLLDSQNGQWLMILDNVDETDIFFSNDHNIIEVEPMGEGDAVALLNTRVSSTNSDPADAKTLVQALECIPLAITHAAAYMQALGGTVTTGKYLDIFRESETNQVHLLSKDELKDIQRDPSIRHAVIATWQISFEHIQKTKRSAADLLALMSMFHKQGIPKKLVQGTTSELEFNDALAPLLGFSFVKVEVGQQAVTMHRLVQLSMRRWLEKDKEIEHWVKKSTEAMREVFPSGEYGTWEECQVLLPHFKETTSHAITDENVLIMRAETSLGAGKYCFGTGEYTMAEGLYRSALEIVESICGHEHPNTLRGVNNLAVTLEKQGKFEEAKEMHRQVLQGFKKMFGREHPYTLKNSNNLAVVLEEQGKLEEAKDM
ncbi:hypothetical protein GGP41_007228 [Bipolaris sorokiniana]|uniref:DUF7779 domain-containing protein n=1 Tax=Cochliobolus sativus TaxID=45130 RepID=A0A8H6E0N1_COCSA|nr:hypothetical protein GGP41_007228 [Bipolaris sorokiniana]